MGATDKARNRAQRAKGKIKEVAGKVTGNDKLRATGQADQIKGNLKQAGEKIKDAFKDGRKSRTDNANRAGQDEDRAS
ncbi:MAG: hypothetical protein QOF30_1687 [Acidimicrobiaceae bacterium]|jgi:uncharacterized protein YjbJ (UPF0337 family)|nr:hypothetical protein [Acidimicrobiaceae bacterium]